MQLSLAGELEIERRLDAFARVRLGPSPEAKARMRARVMREARIALVAQAGMPVAMVTDRTARRGTLARRGAGLLLAAGLTLGVAGGAMAASQAGGPLYPTRIWLETLTLPSDAASRAAAEIVRMDARINEVLAAAARGDRPGVEAALLAYQQIADEALVDAAGNEAVTERLRVALDHHVDVLQTVAAQVPPQAREAIERNINRAIEHNDNAIENSQSHEAAPTATDRPNAPGGPNGGPQASSKPDKTPVAPVGPAATDAPNATPAPHPTPSVGPPHGPPSAKPDKTPKGQSGNQAP